MRYTISSFSKTSDRCLSALSHFQFSKPEILCRPSLPRFSTLPTHFTHVRSRFLRFASLVDAMHAVAHSKAARMTVASTAICAHTPRTHPHRRTLHRARAPSRTEVHAGVQTGPAEGKPGEMEMEGPLRLSVAAIQVRDLRGFPDCASATQHGPDRSLVLRLSRERPGACDLHTRSSRVRMRTERTAPDTAAPTCVTRLLTSRSVMRSSKPRSMTTRCPLFRSSSNHSRLRWPRPPNRDTHSLSSSSVRCRLTGGWSASALLAALSLRCSLRCSKARAGEHSHRGRKRAPVRA